MLIEAYRYRDEMHWSVFPVGKNKKPTIETWEPYQTRFPADDEMQEWWGKHPWWGIAVATGKLSGIYVVDVDEYDGAVYPPGAMHNGEIPLTVTSRTGSGGKHYFSKYPATGEVKCSTSKIGHRVDVKGHGGYIVLPPSYNMNGQYQWIWPPYGANAVEIIGL